MAVAGGKDGICGIGRTMAALGLRRGVAATMRRWHRRTGVVHDGVVRARRCARPIHPRIRAMIQAHQG